MELSEMLLTGLGVFMVTDSSLSMVLGDRYMYWGLGYAPGFYKRLIKQILSLPTAALSSLKLFELAAGSILLFLGLT